MTVRTRYFVVASLLTTAVGISVGLLAYYGGFQGVVPAGSGPAELRYVPADATLVAFADVQAVMASELRQQLRRVVPPHESGHEEFEQNTGINIERDIDHVVASLAAPAAADRLPASVLVLARGRFDAARIEAAMRQHGARVETHRGASVMTLGEDQADGAAAPDRQLALAFVEPEVVAVGSPRLVRSAIDLREGGENVTANRDMFDLVQSVRGDVWAVGLFDALTRQARLPAAVAERLPPVTRFAASGQVNGGLQGAIRVETTDEQSADQWRDVVRGILAMARLQAPSDPELRNMLDSFELGGTGTTIALSFAIPPSIVDWLGQHAAADSPPAR